MEETQAARLKAYKRHSFSGKSVKWLDLSCCAAAFHSLIGE